MSATAFGKSPNPKKRTKFYDRCVTLSPSIVSDVVSSGSSGSLGSSLVSSLHASASPNAASASSIATSTSSNTASASSNGARPTDASGASVYPQPTQSARAPVPPMITCSAEAYRVYALAFAPPSASATPFASATPSAYSCVTPGPSPVAASSSASPDSKCDSYENQVKLCQSVLRLAMMCSRCHEYTWELLNSGCVCHPVCVTCFVETIHVDVFRIVSVPMPSAHAIVHTCHDLIELGAKFPLALLPNPECVYQCPSTCKFSFSNPCCIH